MAVTAKSKSVQLRKILVRESETRRALKLAKAERFIEELESGAGSTLAWQRIATDPNIRALEAEYDAARIDLLVENAFNHTLPTVEHAELYQAENG